MRAVDLCRIFSIEMFEAEQFGSSEKFAIGLPTTVTPENAGPGSLGRFWTVPTHRGRSLTLVR
jgi:hypothetical protein